MARFFHGYPWRWCVFDIGNPSAPSLQLLTILDHLAADAAVDLKLNSAASATLRVPSDNPEVYIESLDGDPFVDEGSRALIGLRREGTVGWPTPAVWHPRFCGIIMQPQDQASTGNGAGHAYTTVNAFDPRQLLYRRPVRDADGNLPTAEGLTFRAANGTDIALALLANTVAVDGPVFIDITLGTFENVGPITITFQRGQSVGEAWDALSDYMDILLDPIYDPFTLPGDLVSMSVYETAGTTRNEAIFAWDLPSRSLTGISRVVDGTQRVNREQPYGGFGGVEFPASVQSDAASIARNGVYYITATYPATPTDSPVVKAAQADVDTRKDGVVTITIDPAPERSPIALVDYELGDEVPIYASASGFRKLLDGTWRITRIPIRAQGRTESVAGLEVTTLGQVS